MHQSLGNKIFPCVPPSPVHPLLDLGPWEVEGKGCQSVLRDDIAPSQDMVLR